MKHPTYKLTSTGRTGEYYIPAPIIDTLKVSTLYNSKFRPNTINLFWICIPPYLYAYYEIEQIRHPIIGITKIYVHTKTDANRRLKVPEFFQEDILNAVLIIEDKYHYYYKFELRGYDERRTGKDRRQNKTTSTQRDILNNTNRKPDTSKIILGVSSTQGHTTKKPPHKRIINKPTGPARKQTRSNDSKPRENNRTIQRKPSNSKKTDKTIGNITPTYSVS